MVVLERKKYYKIPNVQGFAYYLDMVVMLDHALNSNIEYWR